MRVTVRCACASRYTGRSRYADSRSRAFTKTGSDWGGFRFVAGLSLSGLGFLSENAAVIEARVPCALSGLVAPLQRANSQLSTRIFTALLIPLIHGCYLFGALVISLPQYLFCLSSLFIFFLFPYRALYPSRVFFFLSCHRRSVVLYLSPLSQTIPYIAKFNSGKSCHCRSAASFVIVYQRSCTGDSNR